MLIRHEINYTFVARDGCITEAKTTLHDEGCLTHVAAERALRARYCRTDIIVTRVEAMVQK